MTDYRTENQLLLAKIEATSGTEVTPVVGTDAVKVVAPIQFSPNFPPLETNYSDSSLSASAPIVGGGNVGMRFGTFLKGSGTGGTAPDTGVLLRACGLSQTLTASNVTGTAQAGAASTITLAAGASAVDDAYKGMVINTTGGTGSGQTAMISAYVGSTKVATVIPAWSVQPDSSTTYSIFANALYVPVSSGLETATLVVYQHHNVTATNSRRRRLVGGAGNVSMSLAPRGLAALDFTFTGILPTTPDDVARPSAPTYQSQDPEPVINALAYLGGAAVKFADLSLDLGNGVEAFDNPATSYGYDYSEVIRRQVGGRLTPNLTLVSSRNAFADFLASTERSFWLRWGSAAGKRVSIFCPALRYTGHEPGDVRGYAVEAIPFRATGTDTELYICIH